MRCSHMTTWNLDPCPCPDLSPTCQVANARAAADAMVILAQGMGGTCTGRWRGGRGGGGGREGEGHAQVGWGGGEGGARRGEGMHRSSVVLLLLPKSLVIVLPRLVGRHGAGAAASPPSLYISTK